MTANDPILTVRDLVVEFPSSSGPLRASDRVSFEIGRGQIVGVVGESGSGKSVSVSSILGLNRDQASKISGSIRFHDKELLTASDKELRRIRGGKISLIPQNPMTAFNPVRTIGVQLMEAYLMHHPGHSKQQARDRVIEVLSKVGIPGAEKRIRSYAHEFSGGMRQRATIAMALLNEPELIIADEPTTALDVTIQAQILDLLKRVRDDTGAAILIVTHDLGVLAEVADRVLVMYASRVVETAPIEDLFARPQHPYSRDLQQALPSLYTGRQALAVIPGMPPMLSRLPGGCSYHPRCAMNNGTSCVNVVPELVSDGAGRSSACHRREDLGARPADEDLVRSGS